MVKFKSDVPDKQISFDTDPSNTPSDKADSQGTKFRKATYL